MSRILIRAAVAAAVYAAATPAAAQQGAQVRLNLTPAGQAVAKRYLGTPDPQAQALAARANDIGRRQQALVAAPKLDLVQFAVLLRQQEQIRSQLIRMANERLLKMLRELSEADRVAMMRGLSNPTPVPAPPRK